MLKDVVCGMTAGMSEVFISGAASNDFGIPCPTKNPIVGWKHGSDSGVFVYHHKGDMDTRNFCMLVLV